ncbi:MAG TPA: Hsp20/alpha crystallin family protein [Acholeplasmataceae bacterium]|nr:Hsp20/alpha crystallin family protein [Acholeplasmataceae bacterium]
MKIIRRRKNFFDSIFDDFFDFPTKTRKDLMRTEIKKVGDNYQIDVELPGFNKEDLKINLEDGYLTISAKREHAHEEKEADEIIRSERYYGEFARSYYVGNISESEITAKYNNGILTVLLPCESNTENKKYITIE